MGGAGLIETYRVGFVADKSHKYMFVTGNDIKRIKYHFYASCNIICECKSHFTPISVFTSGIYVRLERVGYFLMLVFSFTFVLIVSLAKEM